MKTYYDVLQLIKKYGTYIYIGNREADLIMIEEEIKELYANRLISSDIYIKALQIVRSERRRTRQ